MAVINPYRPGAGKMPAYLAGREEDIKEIDETMEALNSGIPVQSYIFWGLRGVGKTVLLNTFEKMADEKDIFYSHIEAEEKKDFILQLTDCIKVYMRQSDILTNLKTLSDKVLEAIKSLVVTYKPEANSFSLSVEEKQLYISNSLSQSLTTLLTSVGAIAEKKNRPLIFFIDEIQYLNTDELDALTVALHRCNQLNYPIMVLGAGLPKIHSILGKEKTYTERLFNYRKIDSLSREASIEAIVNPAKKCNVTYTDSAIQKIIDITEGYPFFIQQLCEIVYKTGQKEINDYDVEIATEKYYQQLDEGFFRVRYERCSNLEKQFIVAMVKCGNLPCTISNIAKNMKRQVKSISPTRGQLISKGIIYSTRHSELDFTVPEFDKYIKRTEGV